MKEEKPKYGMYVRNLTIIFLIFGLAGLLPLVLGIYLKDILGVALIIVGITIIAIFLWPGIGLSFQNFIIGDNSEFANKISSLNIKVPKILDVGCGTGRTVISMAKELKNGGEITGIDIYNANAISGNALETVQRNARIEGVDDKTSFQYGSATDIPFENETFDIVTVASVLHEIHNLKEQEKAVQEIFRVLKPEGYLLLGEWNRTSWQLIAFIGIFCFVFKPYKYWDQILKKLDFKNVKYENKNVFGIFTAKR